MTTATKTTRTKSSMARTFTTTVAGMGALAGVVMAASFDQDGHANAAAATSGLATLEAMTATPQATADEAVCRTVAVLIPQPTGSNVSTMAATTCH